MSFFFFFISKNICNEEDLLLYEIDVYSPRAVNDFTKYPLPYILVQNYETLLSPLS